MAPKMTGLSHRALVRLRDAIDRLVSGKFKGNKARVSKLAGFSEPFVGMFIAGKTRIAPGRLVDLMGVLDVKPRQSEGLRFLLATSKQDDPLVAKRLYDWAEERLGDDPREHTGALSQRRGGAARK